MCVLNVRYENKQSKGELLLLSWQQQQGDSGEKQFVELLVFILTQ